MLEGVAFLLEVCFDSSIDGLIEPTKEMTMNVIEQAVAPLKSKAMDAAEQYARRVIAWYLEKLAAANWDAQVAFPRPRSFKMSRNEYHKAQAQRQVMMLVTESAGYSSRIDGPEMRKQSDAAEARFIEMARIDARLNYDAYVAKLVSKIGEADSAELSGDALWTYSVLKVAKGDKIERWKTRQILNVSKLGKVFNQFPTRLMK